MDNIKKNQTVIVCVVLNEPESFDYWYDLLLAAYGLRAWQLKVLSSHTDAKVSICRN